MLSTAQHLCGIEAMYKPTHVNHPCAVWVRESIGNYNLLLEYTRAVLNEYTFRYEKFHACESILYYCSVEKPKLPNLGITPIRLAMPDEYKCADPVLSYRRYYMAEKRHIAEWKKRERPDWWE